MDKIEIKQNMILQFQDETGLKSAAVMPIEFNFKVLAKHRLGPNYMFGRTQEIKAEKAEVQVNFKACQRIKFGSKPKTPFEDYICSMQPLIQEHLGTFYTNKLQAQLSLADLGGILGFLGQFNEYYPMPEKWPS